MPGPLVAEVVLADPNPGWSADYRVAAERIEAALSSLQPRVEHIGSTAVPLRGRPTIDIQVAVDPASVDEATAALAQIGFASQGAAFNVHVFGRDDATLAHNRLLRDYLRANPEAAEQYAGVKRRALRYGFTQLSTYAEAKASFVAGLRDDADRWFHTLRAA